MTDRPRRADGIEINIVTDGYVVYDGGQERVHYLNETAAVVLELCTGDNTEADIMALLTSAYQLPETGVAEITRCLDQLRSEGLIV